jgi:hypothetical protein
MGITARTRMARYLRTVPTGDAPAAGGGGAPAPQPAPALAQGAPAGQPAAGAPPAGQPAGQPAPATGDQLGEGGLKALHTERDARKEAERQLAETKRQLQAATDQRPADQKLADQVAELTRNLETERTERLRSQTALHHGITPENAALLTGATPEELTAQATRIAALQQAATATGTTTTTTPGHQPHPGQGTPSSGEPPKKTLKDGSDAYTKFKATKAVQTPTPST